jgi:PAS domain S-box-containing protein
MGDAVICTDRDARITSMNAVAASLTAWSPTEAVGQPLEHVFHVVNEQSRLRVDNPAGRALSEGAVVGLANHTLLIGRDGMEHPIDDSAAPVRDDDGQIVGCVLAFRNVADRRQFERELNERLAESYFLSSIVASSHRRRMQSSARPSMA